MGSSLVPILESVVPGFFFSLRSEPELSYKSSTSLRFDKGLNGVSYRVLGCSDQRQESCVCT